jgi:hypothetical protein
MRVYVASKAKFAPMWCGLRAALAELGVDVRASWLTWPGNRDGTLPSASDWSEHWRNCIAEASEADVCLFYAEAGSTQCGALLEVGASLAAGRQVFVVSDYKWTAAEHPRCRTFASLEAAVSSLIAMAKGERSRVESQNDY